MYLVRIHQQYAQIGMNTKKPAITLHSTLPQVILETQPGRLEMSSPRPKVHIDQRQCFADANMRTPEVLKDYLVSLAKSATLEAIGQISAEGDALADFKNSTVAGMAASKSVHSHEFEAQAIPQQPPEISFETYPVQIEYQPGSVDLQLQKGMIESQLDWGKVDIYLLQKNYVQYEYSGKILSSVA
ncbi:MAG: DUF6470 family protein [Deltaproteobacteria bacterium]